MSALSNYLENALVNHVLRNTAYTTPGTSVYVGLIKFYETDKLEAGTVTQEISGGSYARVQVTSWDSPSNGATQNTSDVTFPTSSADWEEMFCFTALSHRQEMLKMAMYLNLTLAI